VANAFFLLTVAHAGFNAKRLARKKNHRSIVGKGYLEEGPIFPGWFDRQGFCDCK